MSSTSTAARRLFLLSLLVVAVLAAGWASPAAAAGRSYDEAPIQVVKGGLTAEQHVRRQIELSWRLARELPPGAEEGAVSIPLTSDEINAVDRGPRSASPLKIGLVKAMAPAIVVAGLELDTQARLTADGGLAWATVVRSQGAGAIRLHVQDLSLPRNAELYVYSPGGQAFGPYTGSGPDFSGDFWTTAVFGPEVILQIRLSGPVSDADLRAVSFRITEAGLITEKFAGGLRGDFETPRAVEKAETDAPWPCGNRSCIVDATCTRVAAANPAKLAVAKMEWVRGAFIYTCTGGLIADNNPTQDNFFLTANHCLSHNNTARNVSFYWQYSTSSCDGTCPANSGWPFVTTGATVSKSGRKADFTLLQLTTSPPAGSVLLGWTSAPVANTNGAQLYRISNPQFGPQVYSQHNVDTGAGTCRGWPRGERIYSRDITGAIDGGSSGSPVVNASSQIVGQLTGTCGFNPNDPCASGRTKKVAEQKKCHPFRGEPSAEVRPFPLPRASLPPFSLSKAPNIPTGSPKRRHPLRQSSLKSAVQIHLSPKFSLGRLASVGPLLLRAHERHRGREASGREGRVPVPGAKLLGGVAVGGHEPGVGFPELPAHGLGRRVDERRGRLLQLPGAARGLLGEDLLHTQRFDAGLLPPDPRFLFDLLNQGGHPAALLVHREVAPAREGIEDDGLLLGVLVLPEGLSPLLGGVLLRPVEPVALEGLALDQGSRAVDPGPLVHPFHQIFLDAVRQMVTEAFHLGRLLVAHLDGLVAPGEDRGLPVRPAGDLLRQVSVEVLHELCELAGVLDPDEHVVVAREHHEAAEGHSVEALGAQEDLRRLESRDRAAVRDALEVHLRHEPTKVSRSRIKRLRDLAHPQYRLRVGEIRVFYDVVEREVRVHAILFKPMVEEWLKEVGEPS